MKTVIISACMAFSMLFFDVSFALDPPDPIHISAEQAFDAVQTQTDPITGMEKTIALVDIRTRAEYYWVGAASQVDQILTTTGESIVPDLGKALLSRNGRFLRFELNGRKKRLQVKKVAEVTLSPIAINIPFKYWDEDTGTLTLNFDFAADVDALEKDGFDVLIFFCRSGERSEDCLWGFDASLFDAIYEIDQPDGKGGRGGFEGTSFSNAYNGYRGFPARLTKIQAHPSVSWKDTGLPIKTSLNPLYE